MSSRTSSVFSKPMEATSSTKRHRKAAVACIACKIRKIRCSGSAPCETCVSLDTKCIIDETLDGRRKVALNRRLEELFHFKWILEALLLCLRNCRGKRLVAILELLLNDSPMPHLAAALCSLIGQCSVPVGDSKEIAELQQNLANYVHENDSVISSMSEHDPNDGTPEDCKPPITDEMIPPRKPPSSATAMEQLTNSQNPYLPIHGSPDFLFREPSNIFETPTTFPGSLSAGIAAVAEDVGLNVIIDCMKGACIEMPSHDLFNGYLAHSSRHTQGETEGNEDPSHKEPGRKRSSPEFTWNSKSEGNASKSKKRPLSTIIIPPSHSTFAYTPATAVLPSSNTSSGRPSMTPSAVCSPFTEYSPLPEHTFHSQKEHTWPHRQTGHYMAIPQVELNGHPMACAIISYMDLARTMLTQGKPIQEIFGPGRAVVDLLFRKRRQSDPHSVCHFAAELCAGIKDMEMSVKLGMTFMYIYLLRWMILPSSDSYSKVPELYRPTPMQISIPHCAIIEFCPFPLLRDALCRRNRDFLAALTRNISCNWPYPTETCIERDPETGHIMLTDDFARHCLSAGNWTVQPAVFETFPECRGLIRTLP